MAITLYTGFGSGNSYKAELLLELLDVPYAPVQVSIPKGEHRNPDFLKLTPFGQIPVLVDGDVVLTDSQAILCYLARQYGGAWMTRLEGLPRFRPMPRIPGLPEIPLVPVTPAP